MTAWKRARCRPGWGAGRALPAGTEGIDFGLYFTAGGRGAGGLLPGFSYKANLSRGRDATPQMSIEAFSDMAELPGINHRM